MKHLTWHEFLTNDVESVLEPLVETMKVFLLKCRMKPSIFYHLKTEKYMFTVFDSAVQLLCFPKKSKTPRQLPSVHFSKPKPSISILLLDSFSRTTFYRTLPKTIKFLEHLNKSRKRRVLDFELFQSISRDTYWHLYNLFDGPNATEEDGSDIFYFKKAETFFRKFKQAGYLTGYSWDICYSHVFRGADKGYEAQWTKFVEVAIKLLKLDDVGLAEVMCELLVESQESLDLFRSNDKCLNGRHIVDYQLSQLADQQAELRCLKFTRTFNECWISCSDLEIKINMKTIFCFF